MGQLRSCVMPSLALSLAAVLGAHPGVGSAQEQAGTCAGLATNPDRRTTPSSACTACHDGTRAPIGTNDHPVDIAYEPSSDGRLRPEPERFNPHVVVPDGRITCLTCHDPASKERRHLAAPTGGPVAGRLCVACHVFE